MMPLSAERNISLASDRTPLRKTNQAIAPRSKSFVKRAISTRTLSLLQSHAIPSRRPSKSPPNEKDFGGVKKLDLNDMKVGNLVGQGGFNHVYEVSSFIEESLVNHADETDPIDGKRTKFVIKHLSPSVMRDQGTFRSAAIDLTLEAKLLSSISHKNIIRLHGVTKGCVASAFSSQDKAGYFLLLDRLECTLKERKNEWLEDEKRLKSGIKNVLKHSRADGQRSVNLSRRLNVAYQISCGMYYLHNQGIIYRDLKPENVGFDSGGRVKIFDFGLARRLPTGDDENLTGLTGTPRYMAPEVHMHKKYGLSADVYSFGLVLWEICALKEPFGNFSLKQLQEKVVYGSTRPKLSSKWPSVVKSLMKQCWSASCSDRIEFGEVTDVLAILSDEA